MVNMLRSRLNMPVQNSFAQPVLFAGEGAVNAPLAELERAKKLENSWLFTYTPEDIYARTAPAGRPNLTGWFKGADGRWRFEVDDSQATLRPDATQALSKGSTLTAADVIAHPEIFNLYPELKDIKIKAETRPGYGGSFNRDTRTMTLALDQDPKEVLSAALHELQHAVQLKEGFARGGSPENASLNILENLLDEDFADIKFLNSFSYLVPLSPQEQAALDAAEKRIELRKQERKRLRSLESQFDNPEDARDAVYQRLRGEVEARNVQNRFGMDAARRRKMFPLRSQEFPSEEQFGSAMRERR